jgi:hypothetical protein
LLICKLISISPAGKGFESLQPARVPSRLVNNFRPGLGLGQLTPLARWLTPLARWSRTAFIVASGSLLTLCLPSGDRQHRLILSSPEQRPPAHPPKPLRPPQITADHAELLREQCLNLLLNGDLTADEIALMIRKSVLSVRPRVSELYAQGLVWKSNFRRKNASGCSAVVWTTRKVMK